MAIRFLNTLSRKVEEFKPLRPNEVTMYGCGPTVYNYVHIGNLRAFSFYDFVHRYLSYRGYKVNFVMNITDIDDKTMKGAKSEGKTLNEFTEFYTAEFLADLKTLKIKLPNTMPKATQEVDGMVAMIKDLIAKGYAYKNERGDIYFKISAFPEYGALSNIDRSKLKKNADGRLSLADEYSKEDASDFALWKAWEPEDEAVFWDTEIGKGRPGWHIECSVMSAKYLGQPFDIHCGGVDLIFPHHTNEIAQSECSCGKKFVNYWLHSEHLIVNGRKMSKSLGNFFTLRDLLAKGYPAMAMRYELLKTHYRAQLDFREENLQHNIQAIAKFSDLLERLQEAGNAAGVQGFAEIVSKARANFIAALDDDLNISLALAALHEFVSSANSSINQMNKADVKLAQDLMSEFDSVLGFIAKEEENLPAELQALIDQRVEARKNKDFKRSDELRDELLKHGIAVKDGPKGTRWSRI